jgi:REP element-mobilizing transposase RayT
MVYTRCMLKQANFFQKLNIEKRVNLCHGGENAKGKRKIRRPLDSKKPLHIVMRATKARGELNLLKASHQIVIKRILYKQSKKFGVRIAAFANVGNHLHLMLQFSNRKGFQNFLRSASAMIARAITRARRGTAFGKFWDALAFSRILTSNKEKAILVKYITANVIEAKSGRNARRIFLAEKSEWEKQLHCSFVDR